MDVTARGSDRPVLLEDGAPRLDQVSTARAAEILGVTETDLLRAIELGWEPYDPGAGDNNFFETQAELAEDCGVSTRHLRALEKRGLPSVGQGKGKVYPWPLAEAWFRVFRRRSKQREARRRSEGHGDGFAIQHLDPCEAMEEYRSAVVLVRAYNWIRQRRDIEDHPDPKVRARAREAREYIAAGRHPPHWSILASDDEG